MNFTGMIKHRISLIRWNNGNQWTCYQHLTGFITLKSIRNLCTVIFAYFSFSILFLSLCFILEPLEMTVLMKHSCPSHRSDSDHRICFPADVRRIATTLLFASFPPLWCNNLNYQSKLSRFKSLYAVTVPEGLSDLWWHIHSPPSLWGSRVLSAGRQSSAPWGRRLCLPLRDKRTSLT